MAAGWWAATLISISTKLSKLTTSLTGGSMDVGTIATTLQKPTTQATAPGSWSLGMSTTLKKMSTIMPGTETETGTIATALNKLTTSASGTATVATYDSVGAGAGAINNNFTFSDTTTSGADVFVFACWDRSTGGITSVLYGSTSMGSPIATVYNNNSSTNGGMSLFRLAGAGTGSAVTVTVNVSGSTSYYVANAISATHVSNVATANSVFGSSSTASQTVSLSSGVVIQAFCTGNAGGTGASFSSFSGGTNEYNLHENGCSLAINIATTSATLTASLSSSKPWAGLEVNLT